MQYRNIKRFTYATLCAMLALFMSVSFVACSDDDDDNNSSFRLESFGPSPAMRGGELIFIGHKLNAVTSVAFANGVEVSELTRESDEKFRITIPQDAEPGLLTLRTASEELQTLTPVTFTEPITFVSFDKNEVLPGDELTINGEYLMSVTSVEFPTGNVVADSLFIEQTKDLIKLKVPAAAQTGKLCLSDGSNLVYTSAELTVTLPAFTSLSKTEDVYPGVDEITITGTHLDLVCKVVFPGGYEVLTSDKAVTVSETAITMIVPAGAQSGDLKMFPLSEVKCAAGSITVVGPVVDTFAKLSSSNMFEPGETTYLLGSEYTMTGKNLDLVASVSCGAGSTTEFILNEDNTTLTFKVPATATTSNWTESFGCGGKMYSNWESGYIVSVTSKQGATTEVGVLFASWGEQLWGMTGVDYNDGMVTINAPNPSVADYISELKLNGKDILSAPTTSISENSITLYIDEAYFSNSITCKFTNGVNGSCSVAFNDLDYPILTDISTSFVAGDLLQVGGKFFDENTVMKFYPCDKDGKIADGAEAKDITNVTVLNSTTLYVGFPASLTGTYIAEVSNTNGKHQYPDVITVAGSLLIVYDGSYTLGYTHDLGGEELGSLDGVAKVNVYFDYTEIGDAWLGIILQSYDGNTTVVPQWDLSKDIVEAKKAVFDGDRLAAMKAAHPNWTLCGGSNIDGLKITKIEYEY